MKQEVEAATERSDREVLSVRCDFERKVSEITCESFKKKDMIK